jgi:hypothetical protein
MNTQQINQCAAELGFEFDLESCEAVIAEAYEGESVWGALTYWLNEYESCADFDRAKYKRIRNKWRNEK